MQDSLRIGLIEDNHLAGGDGCGSNPENLEAKIKFYVLER